MPGISEVKTNSVEKEAGMAEDQAQKDRAGYTTSVEMATKGEMMDAMDGGGIVVGNCYDVDPLGEEAHDVSYGSKKESKGDANKGDSKKSY